MIDRMVMLVFCVICISGFMFSLIVGWVKLVVVLIVMMFGVGCVSCGIVCLFILL